MQADRIRLLNFPLTLSEQYGVPFDMAFGLVAGFLTEDVLIDDAILPEMVERIFAEILSAFPTDKDKRTLGKMFLAISVQRINEIRIILGTAVQKKLDLLSQLTRIWSAK